MAARDESLCHLQARPEVCAYEHVAARVPKGREGDKSNRACPCHDDRRASLSINPGKVHRIIWCCGAECSEADVRAALLDLGVDESCLGRYGLPKRAPTAGMRITYADPVLVADSKRLNTIAKLPRDLNGKLYVMCVQAILEGDGDLPADPLVLLPVNSTDFYGLADRAELGKYKYELFGRWLKSAD